MKIRVEKGKIAGVIRSVPLGQSAGFSAPNLPAIGERGRLQYAEDRIADLERRVAELEHLLSPSIQGTRMPPEQEA